MSKVSLLVAVYNTKRFLSSCLDSLLQQTHTDIEVLCVDDVSDDGSWELLCQYAQKDKRVVAVRQTTNQGQAVARNRALQMANGEFVAMVDSDDWLDSDALEKALKVFEEHPQTDAVLFDLQLYDEQTGGISSYSSKFDTAVLSGYDAFRLSLDWQLHGLYMIRTSLHKVYPFDTTCKLFSDDNTTRMHFLHSREVRGGGGKYFYRKHPESMTTKVSMLRFDYLEANLSMRLQMLREKVPVDSLFLYEGHRWQNYIGMYYFYFMHKKHFTIGERKEIMGRMKYILNTFSKEEVPKEVRRRIGYRIVRPFALFRVQEEIFFRIRGLLGRNI